MIRCSPHKASQLLHQIPRQLGTACTRSIASISSLSGPTYSPSTSPSWGSLRRTVVSFSDYGKTLWCENTTQTRAYSSKRWVDRQSRDQFAKAARVSGLKSRAAFKLLQINDRYRLFRPGMTVVDLGFAPGSWSQVAIDLTKPSGRVLGVDLIPAQPPKGVNAVQGDFLSPDVQREIKNFLRDPDRGRPRRSTILAAPQDSVSEDVIRETTSQSYLDLEREENSEEEEDDAAGEHNDKCVDVVMSDMCEPWPITDGLYIKSKVNPYVRLMNTSGNAFRDHTGSMDLCYAALQFSYETLKTGGHFVCKFYQGAEDKALEMALKAMFHRVHREKPESSRSQSKEAYFVGIKRLASKTKPPLRP